MFKHLPLAQVMISGSRDQTLHWAPPSVGSLLLPLPPPLPLIKKKIFFLFKILFIHLKERKHEQGECPESASEQELDKGLHPTTLRT